jgi:hypothetical protein
MLVDKFLNLIEKLIVPEKTWGGFLRKTISTLLVASISVVGFTQYRDHQRSHWEELPLHTAIKANDRIEPQSRHFLETVVRTNPHVDSIWLYSWPDARNLHPVLHSGSSEDPIPLGYFLTEDYAEIGLLVMEQCTPLKRNQRLYACPIVTENDSWGVVVFILNKDCDKLFGEMSALSHKLSNIIYQNHTITDL